MESEHKEIQVNHWAAFIDWDTVIDPSIRFAKRRCGWLYTFLFFITIASIYYKQVKTNEHKSDRQYVMNYIESSDPLQQTSFIGKMVSGEEFEIDRDLLTKAIRVRANLSDNFNRRQFIQIGTTYGILDSDSTLFVEKGDTWRKIKFPLHQRFFDDEFISYDPSWIFLHLSDSKLTWSSPAFDFRSLKFSQYKFDSLNDDSDLLYFLEYGLARISLSEKKIFILPTYPSAIKNPTKGDTTILTINLPKGAFEFKPAGRSVLFHSLVAGRHHLYYTTGSRSRRRFVEAFPDSLLNRYIPKGDDDDNKWYAENVVNLFISKKQSSIAFFYQNGGRGMGGIVYAGKKSVFFSDVTKILRWKKNIWLVGKTSADSYGVAKIDTDTSEKQDTLNIQPIKLRENGAVRYNANDNGLIIMTGNDLLGRDSILHFYSNEKNQISKIPLRTLVDPVILKNLSSYYISIPTHSSSFEFIANLDKDLKVTYKVKTTGDKTRPTIVPVKDSEADAARIIEWPEKQIFDLNTSMDYFFAVILLIGAILTYFLGLFYILDFKNRDQPYEKLKLPILDQLPTLHEKLDYTKNNMGSLKLRSEIMLWLGLVIGVAGMLAFVYTLKEFSKEFTSIKFEPEFFIRMLRTFGIFAFMEVFSFYFLKQYRITFNEYKRFYTLYLRLMNYYHYLELSEKYPDTANASYKDVRDAVLKDSMNMHDDSIMEKISEFEKSVASDVVKTLATKIPNAT